MSLFCDRHAQADGAVHGPWLPGVDRERDERHIIDYIAYEGFFANDGKGWATSTVRGKVAAVRFIRTCSYYPGPVAGKPRIKASFKALKRRIREPPSAMTCTTRGTPHSGRDNEKVKAAIQSAWFFLLRLSEYCCVGGGTHDYCIRLGDVAFYDGKKRERESPPSVRHIKPSLCRSSFEGPRRTRHGRDAPGDSTAQDWRSARSKRWLTCCSLEVASG